MRPGARRGTVALTAALALSIVPSAALSATRASVHTATGSGAGSAPIAPPVLVPLPGGSLPAGSELADGTEPTGGSGTSSLTPTTPVAAPSSTAATKPSASLSDGGEEAAGDGVGEPLDPAEVKAAVGPLLAGGALRPGRAAVEIVDVATGDVLYEAADRPTVPASTMKLVTAVAVLDALGADDRLRTRTVILDPDAATPRVVVVGAGDPSLTSTVRTVGGAGTSLTPAAMSQLAKRTAKALTAQGITTARVGFDDSLFSGPALNPTWPDSFPAAGIVAPVSALVVDQGRRTPKGTVRVSDPAAAAAEVFAEQLEDRGIEVRGAIKHVEEKDESVPLAYVDSPSIGVLVERMLSTSDNDYAETLARVAAGAAGLPASFAGVSAHAEAVLSALGVTTRGAVFVDGSGLSRDDALAPRTLTALLRMTSRGFGSVASGLPVAGATGSLRTRFDTAASDDASGVVRAKTGTLTGVVGLAGYASRPDGRLLAFAVLDGSADGGTLAARGQVDRAIAALISCDCAADPVEPADAPAEAESTTAAPTASEASGAAVP